MIDEEFIIEFKRRTEAFWQKSPISGFQSPRGARWNPGLTEQQIHEFEETLNSRFPDDLRFMLKFMNGTYYPTGTFDPFAASRRKAPASIYSFPRDIELIHQEIQWLNLAHLFTKIQRVLHDQGFDLEIGAKLVPIFGHRFVLCSSDPKNSAVLSIVGTDAIVYGDNLREYLQVEFLPASDRA